MKVVYTNSIAFKVERRIAEIPEKVVLYSDLRDIAAERQLNRAVKKLVDEKKIARISKGVYAKLKTSVVDGKPTLDGSFENIAQEALMRLGFNCVDDEFASRYNSGESQQVPMRPQLFVDARVNRKIQWKNNILKYESKTKRA